MIYVDINGRLGNQMFEYAFARWLQVQCNDEMMFCFKSVDKHKKDEDGWENSLRYFNIKKFDIYNGKNNFLIIKSNIVQKVVGTLYYLSFSRYKSMTKKNIDKKAKIQKGWQPLLNKLGIYWIVQGNFDPKISDVKNKIVKGHFENAEYFKEIKDNIIEEFTPLNDILNININLYSRIISSNSICVTIRRGDFISNPDNEKIFNVCTKEYFYEGMDIIAKKVKDPKYFIFSDDIEWVKNNMKFNYCVEFENGFDPIWEKIRLMYSCKHFVISNSTFSWWAQYLSRNKNKIVVSPSKWFNNDFRSNLIEESFIKIEVL